MKTSGIFFASGGARASQRVALTLASIVRVILAALAFCCLAAQAASPALMPLPAHLTLGQGSLSITSAFRIGLPLASDPVLERAARRIEARILRQTGVSTTAPATGAAALVIECRQTAATPPALGDDESYQLEIAPAGAHLRANTISGALRGLETFARLIVPGPGGFVVPAAHIDDSPRFPWRGLMLDVCRHWMPVEVIKRNLDAMAAVKLNVFHWHLSDDQGFRAESKLYPRLQQMGSDGHFYTQAEIREVVAYARDRAIRVVPEFDIPGHTTSWFTGYPELASAPGPYSIERHWGIFQPTMDPSNENVYRFLDGLFGEMAALFPDPYFHIGGDEVEDTQWKQSPKIQAFAREHGLADSHALHAYFNRRVQEIVHKHGKVMMGWDEVFAPGLAGDTVIQSWRGQASLAEAARKGYRGILSFGYYLDHMRTAAYHYGIDPLSGPAAQLNAEETLRILGGEACMWVEYASDETIDSRLWPRLAAISERLWSPQQITDVASMYARLEPVSRQLEWTGVRHRANYEPMLDRLAGGHSAEPLRILADAVEALGIDGRRGEKKTSLLDLNRLADAARPESEPVRQLELSATRVIVNESFGYDHAALRTTFTAWAQNDERLQPLIESNSLLGELAPISKNVASVGKIGLEALDSWENGKPVSESWVTQASRELDRAAKPSAEVVLAAVRPVRILVEAVSQNAKPNSGRPVEKH